MAPKVSEVFFNRWHQTKSDIFSTASVSITSKFPFQLTIILAILGTLGVGIASLITVLNVQTQQAAQMSEFIYRIIHQLIFRKQQLYHKNLPGL